MVEGRWVKAGRPAGPAPRERHAAPFPAALAPEGAQMFSSPAREWACSVWTDDISSEHSQLCDRCEPCQCPAWGPSRPEAMKPQSSLGIFVVLTDELSH